MDETLEIISAPVPVGDRVFNDIIQEVAEKTKTWVSDPGKSEQAENISALITLLDVAIRLDKNPAGAAFCAFKLAAEISQLAGALEVKRLLQRNDAMSIEIERVLTEIETENRKATPSLAWQKLIERCGQTGSYCAQWKHETDEEKKEPVIIWFGVQGNQERLTYAALKERLRRRKTTLRTR